MTLYLHPLTCYPTGLSRVRIDYPSLQRINQSECLLHSFQKAQRLVAFTFEGNSRSIAVCFLFTSSCEDSFSIA